MKAKILVKTDRRGPDPGKILEGRHVTMNSLILRDFQCTEAGPYLGLIFPSYAYELISEESKKDPSIKELQNDIRIRDVRIERLIDERDGARANEQRAVAAAERMAENVAQLEKERQELADKLLAKMPVIPQGMADAIEFLRKKTNGSSLIYNLEWVENMAKMSPKAESLPEYIFYKGYNTYFRALIEGYTLEEPPTTEERIYKGVTNIVYSSFDEPATTDLKSRSERIAGEVVMMVRGILAEDRQEETTI